MFFPTELNTGVLIFIHNTNKFVQRTHLLVAKMTEEHAGGWFSFLVAAGIEGLGFSFWGHR